MIFVPLYITGHCHNTQSYRARYDSEGCRGPMKGRTGGCPAVEVSIKDILTAMTDIK